MPYSAQLQVTPNIPLSAATALHKARPIFFSVESMGYVRGGTPVMVTVVPLGSRITVN